MEVRKYIQQRKAEILKRANNDSVKPLITVGWTFIEDRIAERFSSITPEVSRKVELLEVLLASFIEHGLNLEKLNEIEDQIQDLRRITGRTVQ